MLPLTLQSYARQLNILTNRTTSIIMCLVFNTSRFGRLAADWLVKNITPVMTLNGLSLKVCISSTKRSYV